ncbi:lytic transglycosylase domain-containing protein [Nocardioides sp. MAHUQ-72]|uniref:aggregation-promoting factor C-terminal-like domain-containing protein n=1 Tax=unclassified Nocardioides TaxID=2615069 RepID=UPI0036245FCC
MPKREKYVPKHRQAPASSIVTQAPKKVLRNTVVISSVAVAATGVAVSGGMLSSPTSVSNASEDLGRNVAAPLTPAQLEERRAEVTSRSADRRAAADPAKKAALAADDGPAMTRHESIADDDPRDIARALLPEFGFSADQFGCLDSLYTRESGWRVNADNPSSSAYGIPQALPGEKMASAGADWATNPATQIRWGLGYIQDRYGSPCGAWGHSQSFGWY